MKRKVKKHFVEFTFYGPALFFYVMIMVVTTFSGFYYSMTNWDGLRKSIRFIGLDNYVELLSSDTFRGILWNTILFALLYTILHNVLGLLAALAFQKNTKWNTIMKAILFIPVILSPVIVAFIWDFIYAPTTGPLSLIMKALGATKEVGWLGNPSLAMPLVVITQIWATVGLGMVIYIAGIKGISVTYYEAAAIDGANKWDLFKNITIPLLAPTLTIMIVYDTIASLKVFELIYIMTAGGPGYVTETVTLFVFREAFRNSRMGFATAASVILFIIVMVVSVVQLKILKSREVQE